MNSIWKNTARLPEFPGPEKDAKTDVLIIGGGLTGILTAYAMAREGIDCLLIEAEKICGKVSGNTTAKITSQHGLIYSKISDEFGNNAAYMYYKANEEAIEKYRELCRNISCDFETRDSYIYSTRDTVRLEREMTVLNKLKAHAEYTDDLPLPFYVSGAVRFKDQAQFHPLKFAAGIAEGLNIREHTRARAFEGNTVLTDSGRIKAEKIIIATHFPINNKHGSYFLKMYQHRSYVLALENAPELRGMYMDEAENGFSFRNHDGLLLIGGGSHHTGKTGGGWLELEAFSRKYYPDSKERYRWSTQDCMTLDGIPYIGKYSKRTHELYVATGFNKWGMTSAMIASEILRDMICGRSNPYAELFSPSRTILRKQLLSNAFEAAKNLLTFSTPRCPHMGCALKWNPYERSWDCPCHGSRFSEDGKLLDDPATGNLNIN